MTESFVDTEVKDILYQRVAASESVPTAEAVKELFNSSAFCALLKAVLTESDAQAATLLAIDLTAPQGLSQALLVQGIARGLSQAVEAILDRASLKNTTTENNND